MESTTVISYPYHYKAEDLPNGLQLQQTFLRVSPQASRVHLTVLNNTGHLKYLSVVFILFSELIMS